MSTDCKPRPRLIAARQEQPAATRASIIQQRAHQVDVDDGALGVVAAQREVLALNRAVPPRQEKGAQRVQQQARTDAVHLAQSKPGRTTAAIEPEAGLGGPGRNTG